MPPRNRRRLQAGQRLASPSGLAPEQPRNANVSFEYVQHGGDYCLSRCDAAEVRQAVACLQRMTSMDWVSIQRTGGKAHTKGGLGCTVYKDHLLDIGRPAKVSKDLAYLGVRATERFRIYGFRIGNTFYVLWFDPKKGLWKGS
jgi:hypothetical protein